MYRLSQATTAAAKHAYLQPTTTKQVIANDASARKRITMLNCQRRGNSSVYSLCKFEDSAHVWTEPISIFTSSSAVPVPLGPGEPGLSQLASGQTGSNTVHHFQESVAGTSSWHRVHGISADGLHGVR